MVFLPFSSFGHFLGHIRCILLFFGRCYSLVFGTATFFRASATSSTRGAFAAKESEAARDWVFLIVGGFPSLEELLLVHVEHMYILPLFSLNLISHRLLPHYFNYI